MTAPPATAMKLLRLIPEPPEAGGWVPAASVFATSASGATESSAGYSKDRLRTSVNRGRVALFDIYAYPSFYARFASDGKYWSTSSPVRSRKQCLSEEESVSTHVQGRLVITSTKC